MAASSGGVYSLREEKGRFEVSGKSKLIFGPFCMTVISCNE